MLCRIVSCVMFFWPKYCHVIDHQGRQLKAWNQLVWTVVFKQSLNCHLDDAGDFSISAFHLDDGGGDDDDGGDEDDGGEDDDEKEDCHHFLNKLLSYPACRCCRL